MTKRLVLIDEPPEGGAKTLRYALEDFMFGNVQVAYADKLEGWSFFDAIKPALTGRANVVLVGSWFPHAHKLEGAELQMLDRAYLSCGGVHVVCRPSRYNGDRKPLEVMDALLADNHKRIEYDVNSTLHSEPKAFIVKNLLPAMDEAPIAPDPYVGFWGPRALAIVADKNNFKGFAPPFISFRKDGLSWWLADGLRRAGIPERSLVWVNCRDADDVETDPGPLLSLKPEKIFALGDNASKWCQAYEMDHSCYKHPLAWKRYHPKQPYPLMSALVEAVKAMR